MKIAVMQPYLLPYIGYYQLMAAVDCFLVLDDVNFIRNGWIHRNRILRNDEEALFTLAVRGASSYRRINELEIFDPVRNKEAILQMVEMSYRTAAFYRTHSTLIADILLFPEENLSRYLSCGLTRLAEYLDIPTRIVISSDLPKNPALSGQDRIIDICRLLGATTYVNAIGGIDLYGEAAFAKNGIDLRFIRSRGRPYQQFASAFIPDLSIIDVLAFNSLCEVREDLSRYELLAAAQVRQ